MFQRSGHYNSETEHFSVSEFLELAPQIRALTSGSPQFQFMANLCLATYLQSQRPLLAICPLS